MQSCLCLCKVWAPPGGKGLGKGRNCHTAGPLPKLPLATFFGPVGWTKVKKPLGDILGKKYPVLSQLCTGDEESLAAWPAPWMCRSSGYSWKTCVAVLSSLIAGGTKEWRQQIICPSHLLRRRTPPGTARATSPTKWGAAVQPNHWAGERIVQETTESTPHQSV